MAIVERVKPMFPGDFRMNYEVKSEQTFESTDYRGRPVTIHCWYARQDSRARQHGLDSYHVYERRNPDDTGRYLTNERGSENFTRNQAIALIEQLESRT